MPERLAERSLGDLASDDRGLLPGVSRRGSGNEHPETSPRLDHAFLLQRPVGVLDRIRIQLQLGREFARSRKPFAGFENSNRHAADDFVRDLAVNGSWVVRPQLNQHISILAH